MTSRKLFADRGVPGGRGRILRRPGLGSGFGRTVGESTEDEKRLEWIIILVNFNLPQN